MNLADKKYLMLLTAILVLLVYLLVRQPEKYRSGRFEYRYGFVDTNPMRRVSDPFDKCSPENFDECITFA
jgi:hypothetical protein